MRHTKFEDSEVLNEFARIVESQGMMKKKAERIYPDFDLTVKNPELELGVKALAAKHTDLYAVTKETGEQLVGEAHPGGGNKLDLPAEKDLGKVETIVEQHKHNEDVARRKPTGKLAKLFTLTVALADALDSSGLYALSAELDSKMEGLAKEANVSFGPADLKKKAADPRPNLETQGPYSEESRYQAGWNNLLNKETLPGHPNVGFNNEQEIPLEPLDPAGNEGNQFMDKNVTQGPAQVSNVQSKEQVAAGNAKARQMLGLKPTDDLMAALKQRGIHGYNNWGELFSQIQSHQAQSDTQHRSNQPADPYHGTVPGPAAGAPRVAPKGPPAAPSLVGR